MFSLCSSFLFFVFDLFFSLNLDLQLSFCNDLQLSFCPCRAYADTVAVEVTPIDFSASCEEGDEIAVAETVWPVADGFLYTKHVVETAFRDFIQEDPLKPISAHTMSGCDWKLKKPLFWVELQHICEFSIHFSEILQLDVLGVEVLVQLEQSV